MLEELAFFALSFVPVDSHASVARGAWLARPSYADRTSASEPFEEDRAALGSYSRGGLLGAQWLPRLFAEAEQPLAALKHAAQTPFAELRGDRRINPSAYAAIRRGDSTLTELLLCDMALAAGAFARDVADELEVQKRGLRPSLHDALAELAEIAPRLQSVVPILAVSLGISGRIFPEDGPPTIYVGGSEGPVGPASRESGLLALHELAVLGALASASTLTSEEDADYIKSERAAIDAVNVLVRGTTFEDDQARRLARLDLSALPEPLAHAELARHVVERLRCPE